MFSNGQGERERLSNNDGAFGERKTKRKSASEGNSVRMHLVTPPSEGRIL